MGIRLTALRGSMVLTMSEAVVYGCSFVRNMILARVLAKDDFGIAATFAMIMMLLEFSSKLGISRCVVQDKDGDKTEFLATAHLVQFVAGVGSALVIAACAWPVALLVGTPDLVGAILVLAVIPVMQGLLHMDVRRFERELRFGPSAVVEAAPQVVTTLLAWPVAVALPDYRAVLVIMVVKVAMSWAASHAMARQPYRWTFGRQYSIRMLTFGWPLVVNGFVMFFALRGDQFLVASFYQMSDFAAYAAAASLTMAPSYFFRAVFASVMLPVMARAQNQPAVFERRYRLVMAIVSVYSAAYAVGVIIGADVLMRVVFGPKYWGAGYILAWLTAANAIRSIRLAPAIAAIAKGDSVNQMISNLAAGAGLFPALVIASAGKPIWMVACCGLVGETVACTVSFLRLRRRDGVPLALSIRPTSIVAVAILCGGGICLLGAYDLHPAMALGVALAAACLAGGLVVAILPESRREAVRLLAHWRRIGWRGVLDALQSLLGTKRTAMT